MLQRPVNPILLVAVSSLWLRTNFTLQDRRAPGYPEIHEGGAKAKEERPTFVNLDNPEHDRQR